RNRRRCRLKTAAWARWSGTGLGVIGGFFLGYAMVRAADLKTGGAVIMTLTTLEGFIFAYLGAPYLLGGWRRVNLRLTNTPLPDLIFGLFGLIVGLIMAVLIGYFVREFPYGVALSAVLAALLGLTGANLGMSRRNELMALISGSEQERTGKRPRLRAALLDTSVIIDGRVLDLARSGFLEAPLIVLKSVLRELQYVADASEPRRRARGRRGLDVLTQLQKETETSL